eukprot:356479-Amphidinium_carterae.1
MLGNRGHLGSRLQPWITMPLPLEGAHPLQALMSALTWTFCAGTLVVCCVRKGGRKWEVCRNSLSKLEPEDDVVVGSTGEPPLERETDLVTEYRPLSSVGEAESGVERTRWTCLLSFLHRSVRLTPMSKGSLPLSAMVSRH